MILPIDPSMVLGSEAMIPGVAPVTPPQPPTGTSAAGFGDALTGAIKSLETTQTEAAKASAELAAGTADNAEAVVMAVEKAKLSMQMAASLRTKGVEALNDVLHTQV